MKPLIKVTSFVSGAALLSLLISGLVFAEPSGGDFEMVSSTIDGGGGTSSGGGFSLTGTIGQPDANSQVSTGATYALAGGFWANPASEDHLFKSGYE
jgi:hypothetical protein